MNTTPLSRDSLVDSIRALALLGVIMMNVGAMVMFVVASDVMAAAGPADFAAMGIDLVLVQGKARSCFAFLFGVGVGILFQREMAAGRDPARLHLRRMLVLLAFGCFNQAFLFFGDILAAYALLGMLLVLVRRWPDARLLVVGAALVLLPPLLIGAAEVVRGQPLPSLLTIDPNERAALIRASYTSADYWDAVAVNWSQALMRRLTDTAHMVLYDSGVLGLFMLGMVAARRRILFEVAAHRWLLRRIAIWCTPIGLALTIASGSRLAGIEAEGIIYGLVTASYAGISILAFGYMAILAMWFARRAKPLQALLAPAGRMSLTNYLASGGIGTYVFYGYGMGRMGSDSLLALNLMAIALFAGLTIFSHLWLARFRHGPAEWLWRGLSAGSFPPMLLARRQARLGAGAA